MGRKGRYVTNASLCHRFTIDNDSSDLLFNKCTDFDCVYNLHITICLVVGSSIIFNNLGYTSPVNNLGYTSPVNNIGYTSPVNNIGYTSPVNNLGYTSPVNNIGYTSPVNNIGYASPV